MAAAQLQRDRRIIRGTLGCPICYAEYPIVDGVVDTRRSPAQFAERGNPALPDEESVMRLAAQLDLQNPGGVVILGGVYGAFAPAMSVLFQAQYIALNPPAAAPQESHASVILSDSRLPLNDAFARGVAADDREVHNLGVSELARLVRRGGRLVLPSGATPPQGMRVLARDERELVAELERVGSEPVALRRGRTP
ncbi:MAG: hypothetical protein ACT4R6_06985 [Gemmatimonadaceae bacterium]